MPNTYRLILAQNTISVRLSGNRSQSSGELNQGVEKKEQGARSATESRWARRRETWRTSCGQTRRMRGDQILEENQTGRRLQSINPSIMERRRAERRGMKVKKERREREKQHDVSGWERLTLSWHVRRHLLSPVGDLLYLGSNFSTTSF